MCAKVGKGTILARWTGSVYEDVAEILSISPPNYSQGIIDTTHMDSTDDFRTFLGGNIDAGEASVEVQFDPATGTHQQDDLRTDLETGGVKQLRITFSDSSTIVFNALVSNFESQAPLDDKLTATFTMKVSGKPVWA